MSEETLPQDFSRYPLAWLSAYFAFGILARNFFETGWIMPLASVAIMVGLATFYQPVARATLPIIFILLGILVHESELSGVAENRIRRIYDEGRITSNEPVELVGSVIGGPENGYDGVALIVEASRLRFQSTEYSVTGRARLFVPRSDNKTEDEFSGLDIRNGSRIRVYCRLQREAEFQNPGVPSRVAMLDSQGIDVKAIVKSALLIENISDEEVAAPFSWIYDRRQFLIAEFERSFSRQTSGVLIASLLGDKHFLDGRTADVFREGGTFHVLVISGLHITFIGGLAVWVVSIFSRRRIVQFTIATVFLWTYTVAVGAEVPVVRASLMFTALLFSVILDRHGSQLNAFGGCVLALLVWRPSDLFTPSFQLTAVSVCAIVGCAFPIVEKLRSIGKWMPTAEHPFPPNVSDRLRRFCEVLYWNETVWTINNARHIWSANLYKRRRIKIFMAPLVQVVTAHLFEGALVSLVVQIWMLPIVIIYFHRVSGASVLLNLWVGIFLAAESFAGVFAVILGNVSPWLAAPLIALTEIFNSGMMSVPELFTDLGFAGFRLPHYSGCGRIIYFLYAAAVFISARQFFRWRPFDLDRSKWTRRMAIAPAATLLLAAVIIHHPFSEPKADGKLTVHFLDVGQGDSALVVFPNGRTMLIDGGGKPNLRDDEKEDFSPDVPRVGEAVVSEFLWEQGYSRIDYLLATHADADHMQGLIDVAKNFEIGTMMLGRMPAGDSEFDELMRVADRKSIPTTLVDRGDLFFISSAIVRVLNPISNPDARTQNNSSIVLKIEYGSRSFLMTGDIEREVEADLVEHACAAIRSDVVKVAHHGSRTSSTNAFVACTSPSMAVISVGRRSRFGHPHPEIVERWRSNGVNVMKTGDKGTITVTTDGDAIETQTFVP